MTGLCLLQIPELFAAAIAAHPHPNMHPSMHPSTVVLALAWIGSVYVTIFAAVLLFFALSEVAARVRERRESTEERGRETTDEIRREIESRGETTDEIRVEPDPIESYPSIVIVPPRFYVHRHGEMPIPLNPLAPSEHSMRIRE